jgi:hypothetical protein
VSLAEKFDLTPSSSYHRLSKTDKASYVLRPKEIFNTVDGRRLYVLDDGSEWTSLMVAEFTGCKPSTASTRLTCYTDPEKVLKVQQKKAVDSRVKNRIENRMYYDPLGHWALLNAST